MATFESKRGDILKQEAEALVNTVNCVGIMGRGIALQFRNAHPRNFDAYVRACQRQEIRPGKVFVFETELLLNPRLIINFPTKRHWRGKSTIADIRSGLDDLARVLRDRGVRSVAVPPLGCGLGGLLWSDVRPMIEQALRSIDGLRVFLFEPNRAPSSASMVARSRVPRMTHGRAALLGLMGRYQAAMMDVGISLLEVHKLMYLLQEAGENLRLRYAKAQYGPYAENLRHVLMEIDGHFITGYGEGEDAPDKQLELKGNAATKGEEFLTSHPATRSRFDRVAELIKGFETPFGLELISTVHWVATHEDAHTIERAIAMVHGWSDRKRMFTSDQVRIAWDALDKGGWLN